MPGYLDLEGEEDADAGFVRSRASELGLPQRSCLSRLLAGRQICRYSRRCSKDLLCWVGGWLVFRPPSWIRVAGFLVEVVFSRTFEPLSAILLGDTNVDT